MFSRSRKKIISIIPDVHDRVIGIREHFHVILAYQSLGIYCSSCDLLPQLPVPLDSTNHDGFPQVPVHGKVLAESEQGDPMPHWCWALRMGYARDRVCKNVSPSVMEAKCPLAQMLGAPDRHAKYVAAHNFLDWYGGAKRAPPDEQSNQDASQSGPCPAPGS